jgi:hypothetical protein
MIANDGVLGAQGHSTQEEESTQDKWNPQGTQVDFSYGKDLNFKHALGRGVRSACRPNGVK